MLQTKQEEYFNDGAISNSKLNDFVSYDEKYGQRTYTPDHFIATHVDKAVSFEPTDPVITGKIVDLFFSGLGPKVWEHYIPVARRSGKEIEAKKDFLAADKTLTDTIKLSQDGDKICATFPDFVDLQTSIAGFGDTNKDAIMDLINQHVDANYIEITMGMKDDADAMIKRALSFRRFKNFLKHPATQAQVSLKTTLSIVEDKDTGVIRDVKVKGMPDFVNDELKLIVDLKTSGNMEMVINALQFRGVPKFTARYMRQLALYNKLRGGGYNGALAVATADCVKWIFIPCEYLEKAWEIMEKDILDLSKFLENPDSIDESIFVPSDTMIPLEDLSIS